MLHRQQVTLNLAQYDRFQGVCAVMHWIIIMHFNFASDVNECQTGIHDCDENSNCNNEPGTYSCTCKDGFTGSPICEGIDTEVAGAFHNKHHIMFSDINECESKETLCHELAECINNKGSFTCKCPVGFIGDGRKSCSRTYSIRHTRCKLWIGCIVLLCLEVSDTRLSLFGSSPFHIFTLRIYFGRLHLILLQSLVDMIEW